MIEPPFAVVEIACFIVFVAVVAVVIIVLLKNFGARAGGGPLVGPGTQPRPFGRGDVQIREAADGFWLELPGVARGSQVRYRCRVGGEDRSGSIDYEPGPQGQFVYTGGPPTAVEVIDVMHPTAGTILPPLQTWPTSPPVVVMPPPRPHQPPRPVPPPPVAHPPAY